MKTILMAVAGVLLAGSANANIYCTGVSAKYGDSIQIGVGDQPLMMGYSLKQRPFKTGTTQIYVDYVKGNRIEGEADTNVSTAGQRAVLQIGKNGSFVLIEKDGEKEKFNVTCEGSLE